MEKKVQIRIPEGVVDRIKAVAANEHRSVNSQIIHMLCESLSELGYTRSDQREEIKA